MTTISSYKIVVAFNNEWLKLNTTNPYRDKDRNTDRLFSAVAVSPNELLFVKF